MKKTVASVLLMSSLLGGLASCGEKKGNSLEGNPFLAPSTLDLQAPDFSKIHASDFLPAFREGMRLQSEEVKKIVDNPETPTFENTLVALEQSGQMLNRVSNVFFALSSADATDSIRQIEETILPELSAHGDAITLNEKLFERIKAVYEARENLKGEDLRLVEVVYQNFVMNGALLQGEAKEKLKDINSKLSTLTNEIGNKIADGTAAAAVYVKEVDRLKGLSEADIAKARELAQAEGHNEGYLLTLTNTTQVAYLADLEDRALREEILKASLYRCEQGDANDTQESIRQVVKLRLEKARLLGFDNFADWKLQNQMAGKAENIYNFLNTLIPSYSEKARREAAELEAYAKKTAGEDFHLEAWDWPYYAQKLKKERYNIDENEVKPYFVVDSVLKNGVFFAANKLYGLSFKERTDLPVYADDVKVYEVFDADGSPMALFYTDFYKRPTKRGGAWMSEFVGQSTLLGTKPVIYNVCNYTKPAEGQPALINTDELSTMFHEFGHALHGLFASQKYLTLSGTNVPRDFVELPSQFNEHWAFEPSVLANYAKHYKTGEPIPAALVERIKAAANFNQAYSLGENLSAVSIDMKWHTLTNDEIPEVEPFEKASLEQMGLYNTQIPPRYKTNYFRHVFAGGYSAGYYSYLWTEVLELNVYEWFKAHGGMTRENGQRFRDLILSRGNSQDLSTLFKEMTGLDAPNTDDLARARGLK